MPHSPCPRLRDPLRLAVWLTAIGLVAWAASAAAAYDPAPSRGSDLTGDWVLNRQLSDDAERILAERLEKQRRRYEQWRRQQERLRPPGEPAADPAGDFPSPRLQRPWQRKRDENLRRLLGISPTLTIHQSGRMVEILSAVESRRVEAGARTQVSMPEGELADSKVGWDGEWFVIERSVRQGPHVVEKFRLMKQTGQLEYRLALGGDSELSGLKLRRIFDRSATAVAPPDPALGPSR